MKRIQAIAITVLMLCSLTAGQTHKDSGLLTAKPEDVGMSSERLARIRVAMQRYVDKKEATDAGWDSEGNKVVEKASFDEKGRCNTLYPMHSEPRLMAGAPLANDVLKCRLKPINYADYKATFNDTQKARISAIFSTGVCDFSKPGVEQVPLKGTYRRY